MRILLVEDAEIGTSLIANELRQEGYAVDLGDDGQQAVDKALNQPYDAIIMGVQLPRKDGWTACRELREAGVQVPLLFLTASGLTEDRIKGLDLGADDYLVTPVETAELLARIRALLRRKPLLCDPVIRIDSLIIDTQSHAVTRAGQLVRLTAKEYALLECLARNVDCLMGREAITRCVWEMTYDPISNLIEEYIKRVRKKIDVEGEKQLIYSRRGEGYILTAKELA